MKEAILYAKLEDEKVRCNLCPRYCVIKKGQAGICKTRVNVDGKLFTLIYAVCSSVAADPIEKKPVFHYYPGSIVLSLGTLGCNFKCIHCQNWHIAHADATQSLQGTQEIPPERLPLLAIQNKCKGVAWTYNEPTIWLEYIVDSARLCKEQGLYTVVVTNGYITSEGLDAIGPYLDVYRVDLKGFNDEVYRKLAKVKSFKPVLESTIRAKEKWGCHVEVVTNVIPTFNDDQAQLEGIARWIKDNLGPKTPWHVTRFVPYLELSYLNPTPVSTLEKARQIGNSEGLEFVYVGNVYGHEGENTYCPGCQRMLIRRIGYTVGKYDVVKGRCPYDGTDLNIIEG